MFILKTSLPILITLLVSQLIATESPFTNRLAKEQSPYLQQHKHNPVDWYPWGEEAFEAARIADKPIFLSIGYSTCHWCHVMERESFENIETAKFLNEHFISIKLDREERPDIDQIYMSFVQATIGSGGWPLNVFLTPKRTPFFGGTYFPPEPTGGRPSFNNLLAKIHAIWMNDRESVEENASKIAETLTSRDTRNQTEWNSTEAMLNHAFHSFKRSFDPVNGGFGSSPKFPQPSIPQFMLEYGLLHDNEDAISMVVKTCESMQKGGIYDALGGGFSRYSVEANWSIPHFEKMLYDNGQLIELYLNAYLVSQNESFRDTAEQTANYLLRDMRHRNGGFYSAEDADSEGHEGKFYTWTESELKSVLTEDAYEAFTAVYPITSKGNFIDHSAPIPLPNQNVLIQNGRDEASESIKSIKNLLFNVRSQRVRPHLDDKILVSWNGLVVSALSRLYAVTENPIYLDAAEKNFQFVKEEMWEESTQTLHHRWRNENRDDAQLLPAYSFYLNGLIDLYEVTLDKEYLNFSISLAESMIRKFHDEDENGFWPSAIDPTLFMRVKDYADTVMPSGNSAAIYALLRLAEITEIKTFHEVASASLQATLSHDSNIPTKSPYLLKALLFQQQKVSRIVITGEKGNERTKQLIFAAHSIYSPRKVILGNQGSVESFAKTLESIDGKPTAYVCVGQACSLPTHDPESLISNMIP